MTRSLNIAPYHDDFDSTKGYHKILFVPGNPVQARELTQIQSILQEQVKRHGDHIFKNGTVVIPGHIYYDDQVKFVKVDTTYGGTNIESYSDFIVGKTITGQTSGVSALVVHIEPATSSDPTSLFIKYTAANGSVSEFISGEVLIESTTGLQAKIQSVSTYTGNGSICTIDEGVYYVNG